MESIFDRVWFVILNYRRLNLHCFVFCFRKRDGILVDDGPRDQMSRDLEAKSTLLERLRRTRR